MLVTTPRYNGSVKVRTRNAAAAARLSSGAVLLQLTARYYRGEDGWVLAYASNLRGVFTQGRTVRDARGNLLDALFLMADTQAGLRQVLARPPTPPPRGLPLLHAETLMAALRPV